MTSEKPLQTDLMTQELLQVPCWPQKTGGSSFSRSSFLDAWNQGLQELDAPQINFLAESPPPPGDAFNCTLNQYYMSDCNPHNKQKMLKEYSRRIEIFWCLSHFKLAKYTKLADGIRSITRTVVKVWDSRGYSKLQAKNKKMKDNLGFLNFCKRVWWEHFF